jgi:hypothetical protein
MQIAEIKIVGPYKALAVLSKKEDGVNHRKIFFPGSDMSDAPAEVQALADKLHTPELAEEYRSYLEQLS